MTAVALASAPASGTTYGNGESIEVVVTLEEPATVDISGGTPRIGLTVGAAAKTAGYLRGSGSRSLVFAYEVQASDTDLDGVSVPVNSLARNGGRIVNSNGFVFRLTHEALTDNTDHKVNGAVTPLSGGVCGRTAQVRAALLAHVQRNNATVADCSQVTTAHLQALTGTLLLSNKGIIVLKSGDFANLTNFTGLFLYNNDLRTLPDGIFDGLAKLEFLFLYENDLRTLPDDIFESLPKLRTLFLNDNDFRTLPGGIFEGLANLSNLGLYDNDLRTLPDDIFEGLAKLQHLFMQGNDLRTLPDDIFEDLASLENLALGGNPGFASFRPTADAGEDQTAELGVTVSLDGSASGGGPWGTNITYDWSVADDQGNPVTNLTLTGGNTATPSFVIPETAPASGYVFTLTMQGKGHRAIGLYKSTDSVSVAVASAPTLTAVALASIPTSGTTYGNGERIEVAVTFEEPATVVTSGGTPRIGLTVGTAAKTAGYLRGSGSRRLVFAYEVQASDTDMDGVSVPANSLEWNGGRIVNSDGFLFRLTHEAITDNTDHKVNGAVTPLSGGVCGRTAQVRAALLAQVQANNATVADCSQVTTAHLQALTGSLSLTGKGITVLKSGDFANLTNLTGLFLSDNNLQTLPDGIFDGLANLSNLNLYRNDLRTLPDDIFEGLVKLRTLQLNNNYLQALPGGIFEGLASLRTLNLDNNDLQTLPGGIFDGLANLQHLLLIDNALRTLPDGIFEDLANLISLSLIRNPGFASFRPTAAAGEDYKAVSGATVSLDGSVSAGGPWGTNFTYDWTVADGEGNPVTDLTLTGEHTATLSFVIPETTNPLESATITYVVTLSVLGKGDRGRGFYKSTDSLIVANYVLPLVKVNVVDAIVTEGTTAQFIFSRSRDLSSSLEFKVKYSGHRKVMSSSVRELANSTDSAQFSVVTFGVGTTKRTLDLATEADEVNEGDGEISVAIIDSSGAFEMDGTGAATVLVQDDDIPEVTLRWVSPTMTLKNNVWEGSMAEGQEIEFELECTGGTLAPGTHKLRIPLRIQELMNHPFGSYNRDYNNRFPCADQPTDFDNYSIATQRYVGPDNGQIEVDLYPQVLSTTSIPGQSGTFNKICYLDSQYSPLNPHPREIRFCPKFTLGAITSARIKVTNRNPVVIVEALDEVITAGGTARFKLKRIWDSDVVNLYSTTFTFNATVSEQFKKTVPTGPLTFAIGETELIVEIPTMTGEVSDKDGMVRFEILAGISEVQATNVGGHYEVYDQLPGITPSGKSSRVASVRILNNYAVPTSTDRTVTVVEDRPYSFQASDFAFTGRDSGDRLVSVKVVTLPAAGSLARGRQGRGPEVTLPGATVTAGDVVAVADISRLKYTPAANAHGSGYASFTFKVSDGESESASANTLTIDVTAVDDPASGLAITGTARVGQTLTADTSNIVDADGLTSPNYRYQWIRVDGFAETNLGTASTHVVTTADQGKKLKVEVTLTDDDSNTATLEAETGTVSANAAPTSEDRTVTMDEDTSHTFGSMDFAFADTDTDDGLVSVKVVTLPGSGSLALDGAAVTANDVVAVADISKLKYTPPANAHGSGYASFTFKVSDGVSESAAANTMTIDVMAVDDPASGLAITGTVRVGQTLTADTSNIVDADGLTSPNYRYQWIRVDGSTETDLGTASTHVVTTADQGKKLKVEVTLTDDDSNTATLEAETGTVSANAAPTSADRTVTMDEDTSHTFGSGDFAFTDTDSGDGLASVKVVTLPGSGSLALDGAAVSAGDEVAVADISELKYTPPADAHGSGYASFTFKVSDGVSESASANTLTMDVTSVNDPATGLPTITGMAREGQELTADAGGIGDVDGLPEVSTFTWQWLRVSGGSDTAIAGATSKTYRVVAADVGAKFKVVVIFTDLDGNGELVISAEYPAGTVSANAAPTSSNRTVTTDEDTAYPFTSADFAFTDTDSGDGLVSVKVVTLPAAGSLALDGAAVTANDVVAVADISKLKYMPLANAHGTGYTSFTFKVSDGVSESASVNTLTINVTAVDDPASGLAITGTARVGQTLTADTSKIADADGLTSPNYRYQWIRVDGSIETDLGTASTHVVTTADEGKKLKVEVTLTDDDSNTATLEAETGTVSDNAAPTSADRTVTMDEDTEYPFTSADFAFTDTDSGDGLVSVKVVTLPGSGSLALDGAAVTANDVVAVADISKLKYTPPANAHGSGYASFTFKVSDGESESASANTLTINVTAVDDPASGLAITGTVRVGQTLTADTSKIVDADGLTNPNYRYQWIRVDGSTETNFSTASTHVVTTADEGKKLKVEVTLTDDDSNTATLEAETGTVSGNAAPTSSNRTVTTDEDTAYPFTSADFAFTDTDSDDVLASVKLVTLPGAGSLALDGVAVTANDVVAVADIPRLRFTPAAHAHGIGYASFTFKVSDGVSESAAVNTMTVDVTAVNDPTTGLPTITGTARVGQTLTADTSNIVDADGLTSPNYRYQWIRVDGGSETDLGTASTHVVATADEGKKLKVEVTLTDDDSNTATLEAETGTVSANAVPTSADRTVTTNEDTAHTFGSGDFAFTDTDSDDGLASVKVVTLPGAGSLALGGVAVTAGQVIGTSDLGRLKYTTVANAHGTGYASFTFKVSDGVSESASANTLTIDVTSVNDPATGLPTITGMAREGQELTADAGGIGDVDGLPEVSTFTWQWLRVSGGSDTAIAGATSKTYRVVAADVGAKFKVVVIFTDLDGNGELVISAEYPAGTVSANAAPTSSNRTVTTDEDTAYPFTSADFAFTDTDSGDGLVSVKVVTLPGSGSLALDGAAVTANDVVAVADIPKLKYTPPANAHGTGYASFTFKVSDGVSESASANTLTIDVTAVDDPSSGLAITGTVRVGQTLTADTSKIVDADGLTNPNYRYQWIRVDGSTETNFSTGSTHVVTSVDRGKKLKVEVTLTDDDSNTATLEAETGTVSANAAPTSSNRTVTMDEDTAHTFGSVDFAFTDTDSGDGLVSVKVVTLPGAGSLALGGVAVTAGQVIGTSDLGRLKYTPPANAYGTGYASFTFKVSDGVSESASANTMTMNVTSVNDPATGLPTITGTARVGQELTADAGGIGDVDGLPEVSTFAWQWLRVSGGSDTAITGATSKTYRVVAADVGAKFKVVVIFTGLDGNAELLISAEYPVGTVSANAAPTSSNRTVTTDEDTAYPFTSADFAFTDTDSGDGLASVKVVTLPGSGSLALDGAAVTANDVVAVADIPKLKYTPPANAHGTGYASFTFKVSDGVSESASANTMTINVTAVDDPASGLAITGTVRVGQTLTADTSKIVDADGLTNPNYRYQWIRVDGSTETNFSTASTHVVASADQGKKLKVEVTLTDDDSNTATLEAETGTVLANATSCREPALTGRTKVWSGTINVGEFLTISNSRFYGWFSQGVDTYGTLSGDGNFRIGNSNHEFSEMYLIDAPLRPLDGRLFIDIGSELTTNQKAALQLHICESKFNFSDATDLSGSYTWNSTSLDWAGVSTRNLILSVPTLPTLTLTLTPASISESDDADTTSKVENRATVAASLSRASTVITTVTISVESADSNDYRLSSNAVLSIPNGALSSLGVVTIEAVDNNEDEADKELTVKGAVTNELGVIGPDDITLTIIDDDNAVPTSANRTVTMDEDTSYTFGSVDFAFTDTDSGDELVSVKVVTLPGSGSLALGGVAVTANDVVAVADIPRLKYTPAANAHGTGYASFTFKVSDGVSESAPANTMTINVTSVNDPATGLPTISGTARVGQTLTADAGRVGDVDGLPTLSTFAWQWLRVSGGSDTAIAGAKSKTYRVVVADVGAKFKVVVIFTDLDENGELVISAEYPAGTVSANAAPTSADRTVTMDEDTSHTFGSVDFAFTDTDSGDGLVSVKVVTLPAAGSLALDGAAVTAGDVVAVADIPKLKYTPPANATGYASFTFKVSDGVSESAPANTLTINVMSVNDPATGLPTITGAARAGQELMADASNIMDADGLPEVSTFAWQWLRVSGGSDTAVTNATSKTYRLVAADVGAKFKVVVSFTDLDGNAESLTSAEYPAGTVSANAAPTSADRTVTMDEDTSYTFGSGDFAFTDTDGDGLVSVKVVTLPGSGSLALDGAAVTANDVVAVADISKLKFTPPANAHGSGYASFTFKVSDWVSESASANTLTINVTSVNDPATGLLTITGTARVGKTLTADAGGIGDVDGLPTVSTFAWQWLRVSGGSDTAITGATSKTYRVVAADVGAKFKVVVRFTDLDENGELVISAEYPAGTVSDNAAPTSSNRTVTMDEDTAYRFGSVDFAFTDTDSGDGLVSVKVVTLPAAGSLALGGVAVTAGQVIGTSDLGRLRYTPVANAHGSGYASFTFKVSDGVSESASANTMTINVTAVDDPASGLDITGTIRVGQTLTADTSKIVDADGLTSPNYRYQWVRVDGSTETDLGTASTHVVTTTDQGKKLKVEVTLTDDDSNTATLEAETGTVSDNAAPTSSNRTVTMDEDTEYPFTSADFAFTDTDSGDGLVSVKVVTLPAAGSLALDGAAVTAGDVVAVSDISKLKYTPPANAHGSGYASFTFKVSDGVSESASANTMTINVTAVDDPASGLDITGTIRVGQTLTADTSKIVDADGLTSPNYRYQWVRVDGSTETNLGTASTHVVTTTDQGKKLKVEVTLTDDDSNTVTLEAETGTVSDNAAPTSSNRTVTMDEDTAYRFGSVDFAFTDTDSGDGLVSVKVVTLPAAGSLALGGVAVTAGQVIGTSDLGRLRYTPVANAHGSGYASFTFKVSDGVSESASANTMTINVTAVDDPASGLDITGTIRVGQTLTADTSKIVDADGLTSPNYRYQWVRVDGSTETDLGTASTHVVTTTDQGKKLKVEVTLTDDDSNTATLEAETGTVSDNAAPTSSNRTVTMDEDTAYRFGSVDFAFTDTDSGDGLVSVKVVTLPAAGSLALGGVAVTAGQVIGTSDLGRLRYTPVANAHGSGYASFTFKVSDGVSESASANTMTINVTAVDDPASGLDITGTIRVGQTLTADTSKIVDADGLTSPNYRYQWVRVDGSTETDLGTASTHVVTTTDQGKKLKVEVTLTDDDSNTATLEAETGTVSDNAAPTSSNRTVTMDEDTEYPFTSADFAFTDTDSGDGLVSVKVVTLPAAGSLALGGVAVTAGQVIGTSDLGRLRYTPVANAHGSGYASFTFKVSDGVSESASANTMTINVTAVDDPASGLDITGTIRVGQTLTADTSKIVDADGLTSPNYRYQWVRVDGSTETDLGTASTHVVTTTDQGKKLKVEVTLTDDDSNTATLEAETGTVSDNAAPTSSNRTVTMDEDTEYPFTSADFAFTDTDSGDGLVSVKVVTLPAAGSLALDGAAVTAGDVVAVADIPKLKYTPPGERARVGLRLVHVQGKRRGIGERVSQHDDDQRDGGGRSGERSCDITGTIRVGQTLTADTSKIVDADGLTSPNYRYQWVRVDGSTETDLGTASTHVVTTTDQGKKLKVEVTLTDDDSNTETLEAETGGRCRTTRRRRRRTGQ